MAKSMYHYIAQLWKRPYDGEMEEVMRQRLIAVSYTHLTLPTKA